MENEKNLDLDDAVNVDDDDFVSDTTSRARNRTVMLTPEITGEVRARLARDMQGGGGEAPKPPIGSGSGGGFGSGGSSYTPASEFTRPGSGGFSTGSHQASSEESGYRSHKPVAEPFVQTQSPPPPPVAPQPSYRGGEGVIWGKESPVVGFLVSYDRNPNGTVFELRSGRMIVTSEAASGGNFLVVADPTVSPMHAIMRISEEGDIQLLDQLSEFGTRILRYETGEEQELSGDKSHLNHGDVVIFGERTFCVCLVIRPEELEDE